MEQTEVLSAAPGRKKLPGMRILRPLVSAGLLVLVLKGTNLSEFLDLAGKANFLWLAAAIALVLAALMVSAFRWQRLLAAQNVKVSVARLFGFYLVGLFFNNLLPTNIGGDIVRIHEVSKHTGEPSASVASVVTERLIGALALSMTAVLGLALSYRLAGRFSAVVIALPAIILAVILLFAIEKWRSSVSKKIWLPRRFALRRRLDDLVTSMGTCLQDRWNVALVTGLSLLFQFTIIATTYFIFLALGLHIPVVYFLLFIPIISALQILPISISGFGVREGAYVYFFGAVGASSAQAIAASLIFWTLAALVSLAGGLIFALRR